MIRLEAFLDDNKAGKVLHALSGLVIQVTMVPVHNAVTKKGKVTSAGNPTTAREVINVVVQKALSTNRTEITMKEVTAAAETYGVSTHSVSTLAPKLAKDGLLKRKERGVYRIINKEAK